MSQLSTNKTFFYLTRRFGITDLAVLYKQLLTQKKKYNNQELSEIIEFLSVHPLRRINGENAKYKVAQLLRELEYQQLDKKQSLPYLIGLGNLLIYDKKIIQWISESLTQILNTFSLRQILLMFVNLYKLNLNDEPFFQLCDTYLYNNFDQMILVDQINYLCIQSNIYCERQDNFDKLVNMLIKVSKIVSNSEINEFLSSFNYHYTQMMFNIYPELLNQDYKNCYCKNDNLFKKYFNDLQQLYKLIRFIIDRKIGFQQVDYFQYTNQFFLNLTQNAKKQSIFEINIEESLIKLQYQYEKNKRILIYDIDYLVQDKVILNCNGPLHYITNLHGQIISFYPNHNQVQRHLKSQNYRVVDINYKQWKEVGFQDHQKELQKIIQLI